MVAVACIVLLLCCSIAGQATLTLSLAISPVARPTGIRGSVEPDEVLIKRTSRRFSSQRPWSPHLQDTGLQPVPPTYVLPIAPPAPHNLEDDHSRWPALNTAAPSHAPVAPHTEPASSSRQPATAKRRPRGSLKNNPALKAQANRESQALTVQKIKNGERVNQTKPDGSKYAISTGEEYQARTSANSRRYWRDLPREDKDRKNKERSERRRRAREREKAEQGGRSWQGPPVRKTGRPRRNWEQELAEVQEGRQQAPTDTRMQEAAEHAVDVPHAPPTRLSPRQPASSSGSRTMPHGSLRRAPHQRFASGPLSPPVDFRPTLLEPDPSSPGHRPAAHVSQRAAPSAATTEDERLRLTLAPPGKHDRLQLTLAQPRND